VAGSRRPCYLTVGRWTISGRVLRGHNTESVSGEDFAEALLDERGTPAPGVRVVLATASSLTVPIARWHHRTGTNTKSI